MIERMAEAINDTMNSVGTSRLWTTQEMAQAALTASGLEQRVAELENESDAAHSGWDFAQQQLSVLESKYTPLKAAASDLRNLSHAICLLCLDLFKSSKQVNPVELDKSITALASAITQYDALTDG